MPFAKAFHGVLVYMLANLVLTEGIQLKVAIYMVKWM